MTVRMLNSRTYPTCNTVMINTPALFVYFNILARLSLFLLSVHNAAVLKKPVVMEMGYATLHLELNPVAICMPG